MAQLKRPALKKVEFQPGQLYVYQWTARMLTGVPEIDDQYSGLEIESDLVIQGEGQGQVAVKMANVKLGKINDNLPQSYEDEDITIEHQPDTEMARHLTKPIRFFYQDGEVLEFITEASDPEWSVNIKKSILSLFNINLAPKKIIRSPLQGNQVPLDLEDMTIYPVYEQGVLGTCETTYEIKSIPDVSDEWLIQSSDMNMVLNVTKTRNLDNCLTEPHMVNDNFDQRGCPKQCRKNKVLTSDLDS